LSGQLNLRQEEPFGQAAPALSGRRPRFEVGSRLVGLGNLLRGWVLAGLGWVGAFYVWQTTTASPPAPPTAPARPAAAETFLGPDRPGGEPVEWCGANLADLLYPPTAPSGNVSGARPMQFRPWLGTCRPRSLSGERVPIASSPGEAE